jgi:phosphohistidine swiveling domain-containing protein
MFGPHLVRRTVAAGLIPLGVVLVPLAIDAAEPGGGTPAAPVVTNTSNRCDEKHPERGRDEQGHNSPACVTPTPTATPTRTPTPTPSHVPLTPTPTATPLRPPLASLEPYFGPVGSSILIQGTGFGTTTGIVLVGNLSAPVQLWSDTSIIVTVPFNADVQAQLTQRLRIIRADGALVDTVPAACFIVSPGTPTPTPNAAPPGTPTPPATAIPTRPTGC